MASWLTKLQSFFAPKPAAATVPVGGYEGAQNYTTDRSYIYPDYNPDGSFDTPEYARTELLGLTRYLVNNYSLVERILTLCENYVVGASGISAQAAATDDAFNDQATGYFDDWARSPFSSVSNELNLYDLQKLAVRELLIAGEIFFVLTKSPSNYPQLIPVQSEQVRSTGKKADRSVDGLFINDFGKVTAYQIFFGDKTPTIVEAGNVIHIKRVKSINQKRGISAFAASLNSLRDHKDLISLEKKAVKVHSALAVTVSKKSGEAGDGLFGKGVAKTTTTAVDRPIPNRALEKAFPGAIAYLGENEKVEPVASDRSTDGFLKFLELLTRDVCLNLSIPYEFVVNPSALTSAGVRFVISDADCLFKNLQNTLIDAGLNRIYTWVTASAINSKKIKASDDPRFWVCSWVVPQSITIDQGRQDRSILDFVDNNLMSLDTYYSARSKNYKDELRQIAQEKKFIQELEAEFGVSLAPKANQQAEPVQPSPVVPEDNE